MNAEHDLRDRNGNKNILIFTDMYIFGVMIKLA